MKKKKIFCLKGGEVRQMQEYKKKNERGKKEQKKGICVKSRT